MNFINSNRCVGRCNRIPVQPATRWSRWVAALSVVALMGISVSCDRDTTASKAPGKRARVSPSTQPAVKPSIPETDTPSTAKPVQPGVTAYLYFQYPQGGNPLESAVDDAAAESALGAAHAFPPARLRLAQRDDGVTGLLFSDDPKEAALSKGWTGDRFYFQFPLQAADFSNVDGAEWWHQASAAEREESPNGVYLRGDRYHLEPTNVIIRLDGRPPNVTLRIAGQFTQYDTMDSNAKPVPVMVRGVLLPRVEIKD
jgi:hypothetical protein